MKNKHVVCTFVSIYFGSPRVGHITACRYTTLFQRRVSTEIIFQTVDPEILSNLSF